MAEYIVGGIQSKQLVLGSYNLVQIDQHEESYAYRFLRSVVKGQGRILT